MTQASQMWFASVISLSIGLLANQTATASNALRIDPALLAFGAVYAEQEVRQEIVIRNTGSTLILLGEPLGSCPACLKPSLSAQSLPPGGAEILTASFNPGPDLGDIRLTIEVPVQGPGDPLEIPVTATVLPAYEIVGPHLYFEQSDLSPAESVVIEVHPRFTMHGKPDPDSVQDPYFRVAWATPDSSESPFRLSVSPTSALPRGSTLREFLVHSTDPRDPPFRIVAAALNRPPLHVFPQEIRVSRKRGEQFRILFMEQSSSREVEILNIETTDSRIRWENSPNILPDKRLINLYVSRVESATGIVGEVVIRTDHEEQQEMRIPVVIDRQHQSRLVLPRPTGFVATRTRCGCGPR